MQKFQIEQKEIKKIHKSSFYQINSVYSIHKEIPLRKNFLRVKFPPKFPYLKKLK